MSPVVTLLLALIVSPAAMFILHIVWHRILSIGGRHVTGHQSAIQAIAIVFVIVAALAWRLVLQPRLGQPLEFVAAAAYVGIAFVPMALIYVNIVNIAETSLHMHTLIELAVSGGLSPEVLHARYDAAHMMAARLDRLTSLGQIRHDGERYHLDGRLVLRFANAIVCWHNIIGVPVPPLYSKQA